MTKKLTERQEKELIQIYVLCVKEYPEIPTYFLWLLSTDYYMKNCVGKKQQRELSNNEDINLEIKKMMEECDKNKDITLYESMKILDIN